MLGLIHVREARIKACEKTPSQRRRQSLHSAAASAGGRFGPAGVGGGGEAGRTRGDELEGLGFSVFVVGHCRVWGEWRVEMRAGAGVRGRGSAARVGRLQKSAEVAALLPAARWRRLPGRATKYQGVRDARPTNINVFIAARREPFQPCRLRHQAHSRLLQWDCGRGRVPGALRDRVHASSHL